MQACISCHHQDEAESNTSPPLILGQKSAYLMKQLSDFNSGARNDSVMTPIANGLNYKDISDLAESISKGAWKVSDQDPEYDGQKIALGMQLYKRGDIKRDIPPCMGCHGLHGEGLLDFPRLSSQKYSYIANQLYQFQSNHRANDVDKLMRSFAPRLTSFDIDALAQFLARGQF